MAGAGDPDDVDPTGSDPDGIDPDEVLPRPLPPEDRLWRHPSEIGRTAPSGPLVPPGPTVPPRPPVPQGPAAPLRPAGRPARRRRPAVATGVWVVVVVVAVGLAGAVELGSGTGTGRGSALQGAGLATTGLQTRAGEAIGARAGGTATAPTTRSRSAVAATTRSLTVDVPGGGPTVVVSLGAQRVAFVVGADVPVPRVGDRLPVIGHEAVVEVAAVSPPAVIGVTLLDEVALASPTAAAAALVGGTPLVVLAADGVRAPVRVVGLAVGDTPADDRVVIDAAQPGLVLDADGAVVGIADGRPVTAGGTGTVQGHGVVPVTWLARLADRTVPVSENAALGVSGHDAADPAGARLVTVDPDRPGDRAGLRPGDVVVAVDDVPIASMAALALAVRHDPDGDLALRVRRSDGADGRGGGSGGGSGGGGDPGGDALELTADVGVGSARR